MTPHQHQAHKRVHEKECYKNFPDLFKEGRHGPTHLAQRVVTFAKLRGNTLANRQAVILQFYRKQPTYLLSNNITNVEDIDVLTAYYGLFSLLFFFGSLTDRCKIELSYRDPKKDDPDALKTGIGVHKPIAPWKSRLVWLKKPEKRFKIQIMVSPDRPREKRLLECIGTLLHGMIHGFMYLWACDDGSCNTENTKQEILGMTGHGHAFLDIAYTLQAAVCDPKMLDMHDFAIGLSESVMLEGSHDETIYGYLGRWGLEEWEERDEVDEVAEQVIRQ